MKDILRRLEGEVVDTLGAFPCAYIAGARQSGKTTLSKKIGSKKHPAEYVTFDDPQIRAAAKHDPMGFIQNIKGPVILDEIQMVPDLFRPIKIAIDEHRGLPDGGRGRFLLTGSASIMALPQLADALVGRMILHTLLPFSVHELRSETSSTFIDRIFEEKLSIREAGKYDVLEAMHEGTFPEISVERDAEKRNAWSASYIETILQRDVKALMEVEKIHHFPNMLKLFASNPGGLLNEASLARETGLNHVTVKRYRTLLEALYLTLSVPAWYVNLGKKVTKSAKVYLSDINLLAYLQGMDYGKLRFENPKLFGQIFENFMAIELKKQLTYSKIKSELYHYRTVSGQEVDFILEGPGNKIAAIEVKSSATVTDKDFRHLETLRQDLGERFHGGYVVYTGTHLLPFGASMWAVPMAYLWGD